MYFKGQPLYPFGFGLSYTTFDYSNLRTSADSVNAAGEINVSVDVKNTGSQPGDKVAHVREAPRFHHGSTYDGAAH
jgi:beta-glucosidase